MMYLQLTVPPNHSKESSPEKETCKLLQVVPDPTEPKVIPLISLLGSKGIPANSTRTYCNTPELSLSKLPPNCVSVDGGIPSIFATPPGWLFLAKPKITNPPQSPSFLLPTASFEVKTIGLAAVPAALILAPRVMINVACVNLSPRIMVPGRMVNVALFFT